MFNFFKKNYFQISKYLIFIIFIFFFIIFFYLNFFNQSRNFNFLDSYIEEENYKIKEISKLQYYLFRLPIIYPLKSNLILFNLDKKDSKKFIKYIIFIPQNSTVSFKFDNTLYDYSESNSIISNKINLIHNDLYKLKNDNIFFSCKIVLILKLNNQNIYKKKLIQNIGFIFSPIQNLKTNIGDEKFVDCTRDKFDHKSILKNIEFNIFLLVFLILIFFIKKKICKIEIFKSLLIFSFINVLIFYIFSTFLVKYFSNSFLIIFLKDFLLVAIAILLLKFIYRRQKKNIYNVILSLLTCNSLICLILTYFMNDNLIGANFYLMIAVFLVHFINDKIKFLKY